MKITGDEDLQGKIDELEQRISELEEENQVLRDQLDTIKGLTGKIQDEC